MYHFIINPQSRTGRGIKIWTTVKQELDSQDIAYTFHFTKYKLHATKIVEEICASFNGIKKIIVLGGDGTINEVINGITNYDEVLLGYIPSGSSNDLVRSLKLPKEPLECLKHILSPTEFKYVDIGIITMGDNLQRKFSVSTGIGFDAAICEEALRSNIKKVLNKFGLGKLTYIVIALKQLISCPFMDGEVTIDNKITKSYEQILLITSMIHKYEGGGLQIAPAANPFDGKLSVCIVHGASRRRALAILPALLFGKHVNFKSVETFDCNTLDIKIHNPAIVHVDGEYPGSYQCLKVSCISKQLRILI